MHVCVCDIMVKTAKLQQKYQCSAISCINLSPNEVKMALKNI